MVKEKRAIKSDGNDFQYKVKKVFTDAGWSVRMSPYYNDLFSEKPREIDIIAEKVFLPVQNNIDVGTVIVRLFVECKYIAEQTTFWFEEKDIEKAKEVVDAAHSFHETHRNYKVVTNHHYLSNNLIAKLYRTKGKNSDGDPIFKAINQCLNATIYYRKSRTDLSKKYDHLSPEELNYPVIICNSFEKFIEKDTTCDELSVSQVTELFQLAVDYAYKEEGVSKEELFYIDVLSIDMLNYFENIILAKEIDLAKQKISDDKREADYHRYMRSKDSGPF